RVRDGGQRNGDGHRRARAARHVNLTWTRAAGRGPRRTPRTRRFNPESRQGLASASSVSSVVKRAIPSALKARLRYDNSVSGADEERLGFAVQRFLVIEMNLLDAVAVRPQHANVFRVREFLEAAG